MNFDFNFWTVLLFLMNFGLAIFVQISTRKKAESEQLKSLEKGLQREIAEVRVAHDQRSERHAQKIARLESQMENAIGNEDMIAVHKRVDEILALSSDLSGQMKVMNDNVNRMLEIMMNRGVHGG